MALVACYRLERILMGYADPPLLRRSVHPIRVLELTKKTKWMRHVINIVGHGRTTKIDAISPGSIVTSYRLPEERICIVCM